MGGVGVHADGVSCDSERRVAFSRKPRGKFVCSTTLDTDDRRGVKPQRKTAKTRRRWQRLERAEPRRFYCGTGYPKLTPIDLEWAENFFEISGINAVQLEAAGEMLTVAKKRNVAVEDFYQWALRNTKPWETPNTLGHLVRYADSLTLARPVIEVPSMPLGSQ